jgi:predicted CoA-binding protein
MHIDGNNDDDIRRILLSTRRIAMVGASSNPDRPSHHVMRFLLARDYEVTPVNPGLGGQALLGQPAVAGLDEALPLDMVDIFRAADRVMPVVEDAIRLGARTIWMQVGVVNTQAAERARAAGLATVMDRCPVIEWSRLGLPDRLRDNA